MNDNSPVSELPICLQAPGLPGTARSLLTRPARLNGNPGMRSVSVIPAPQAPKEVKVPKSKSVWFATVKGVCYQLEAYTRGEARAQLKKYLSSRQVPKDVEITTCLPSVNERPTELFEAILDRVDGGK